MLWVAAQASACNCDAITLKIVKHRTWSRHQIHNELILWVNSLKAWEILSICTFWMINIFKRLLTSRFHSIINCGQLKNWHFDVDFIFIYLDSIKAIPKTLTPYDKFIDGMIASGKHTTQKMHSTKECVHNLIHLFALASYNINCGMNCTCIRPIPWCFIVYTAEMIAKINFEQFDGNPFKYEHLFQVFP